MEFGNDPVLEELLAFVREIAECDVDIDSKLLDDGFIDSFSVLQIVSFIEERCDVTIDAGNFPLQEFASVRTLRDWMRRLRVEAA
jgi:acyl carrier protein